MWWILSMVACGLFTPDTAEPDPSLWVEVAHPPPTGPIENTLMLTQLTPARPGTTVQFEVSGAQPNQLIALLHSDVGPGPSSYCPAPLNHNCVDLISPQIGFLGTADASGRVVIHKPIPAGISAGTRRWYQAAAGRAAGVLPNLSSQLDLLAVTGVSCPADDLYEPPEHYDDRETAPLIPWTEGVTETISDLVLCQPNIPETADTGMYNFESDHYRVLLPAGKVLHWEIDRLDPYVVAGPIRFESHWYPPAGPDTSIYGDGAPGGYMISQNGTASVLPSVHTVAGSVGEGVLGVPYTARYRVSDPCDPDFNEPNDTEATATPLREEDLWTNRRGNVGYLCAGDEDWIQLPANEAATIRIYSTGGRVLTEQFEAGVPVQSFTQTPSGTAVELNNYLRDFSITTGADTTLRLTLSNDEPQLTGARVLVQYRY